MNTLKKGTFLDFVSQLILLSQYTYIQVQPPALKND